MNLKESPTRSSSKPETLRRSAAEIFPALLGLWVAVALIKLGNPVILDHRIESPATWAEAIYQPWPVSWGYLLFCGVFIAGLFVWKWRSAGIPRWLLCLPALWFGWQCVSAMQKVEAADTGLIAATLPHFAVCAATFYLGVFAVNQVGNSRVLWIAVVGAWFVVVCIGWRQHFGGLQELRDYFHSLPNWREQPPELIAKLSSDRIFSTLVYPNALAGAMILFSPAAIAAVWMAQKERKTTVRWILPCLAAIGGLGCLVWSGSKGGWIIALGLTVLALFLRVHSPSIRLAIIAVLIIGGVAGFWIRYRSYFERGATSVSARMDYWKVAVRNTREQPFLGSGPGTFMNVYRRLKPAEAEMTRLVHNDYLEQATDSGVAGAIFFVSFIVGSIGFAYRTAKGEWLSFAVWLEILGVTIQSFSEFGLYIPGLAWPWFLAMGTLVGTAGALKTVDKGSGSS